MSVGDKIRACLSAANPGKDASLTPLSSGGWANVYKADFKGGGCYAAKAGHPGHTGLMAKEAAMLIFLEKAAPGLFPRVCGQGEGVLILEYIENDGSMGNKGAAEAGRALAKLHSNTSSGYGFDFDTIFGPCSQPNPKTNDWPEFYKTRRLLYMGRIAHDAGRISSGLWTSLQKFAGELQKFLPQTPIPSLLHGDFWGGNILFNKGRLAAFIDPAIYYGDGEVDLAFSTLFGSLGDDFFAAYGEIRPIEPGFRDRVDIYNLWGLLFHAYWFGGGYAGSIERILARLGY